MVKVRILKFNGSTNIGSHDALLNIILNGTSRQKMVPLNLGLHNFDREPVRLHQLEDLVTVDNLHL